MYNIRNITNTLLKYCCKYINTNLVQLPKNFTESLSRDINPFKELYSETTESPELYSETEGNINPLTPILIILGVGGATVCTFHCLGMKYSISYNTKARAFGNKLLSCFNTIKTLCSSEHNSNPYTSQDNQESTINEVKVVGDNPKNNAHQLDDL